MLNNILVLIFVLAVFVLKTIYDPDLWWAIILILICNVLSVSIVVRKGKL